MRWRWSIRPSSISPPISTRSSGHAAHRQSLSDRLAVPGRRRPELLARANAFLSRIARDGTLARLTDRYFGHIERLTQSDVAHFIERMRAVLPKYRRAFQAAQASTGIDWRYLAALAYQESHWGRWRPARPMCAA